MWLAKWGIRTQGRIRNRLLLTTCARLLFRERSLHPMYWSRGAIFQAALVNSRQASSVPGSCWLRMK